MTYEVVAFALALVFLAVVTAMVIVGVVCLMGGLRCGQCTDCARWTILTGTDADGRCFHCALMTHLHPHGWHIHRLHLPRHY